MFDIIKGIGGAIGEAVGGIFAGIDKISTTEEEKLTLKTDILRIQAELELQLAKLGTDLAREQAGVIKTEIADGGNLGRSWRPILMLTFGFIIVYAVVAPAFGAPPVDMAEVPHEFWNLVQIGVGGYVTGRTVEKITPAIADAYKGFKDAEGDINMVVEGDMIEDSPTDRKRRRGK